MNDVVASGGLCAPLAEVYAARPDATGLAMIAVYPEPEEAGLISSDDGHEAETMHVTMVFLGEADEIDLKAAARAVGSVSGSTAPLSGVIGGVGLFGTSSSSPDSYPQIAIPDVVGLAKLRADLVNALAEEGITSGSDHDWVPHMTLATVDEPELANLDVLGEKVTFNQISLVVADERKDFPFDPEGSSDDVHENDDEMVVVVSSAGRMFSRAEQRRRGLLIMRGKELA